MSPGRLGAALIAAVIASSAAQARGQSVRRELLLGKAPQVVERDRVEVAPAPHVSITEVTVDNRLGDVRIEGHDGPGVTIYAVKRADDEAIMDRLKVSLVPDPAGPVSISTSLQVGPESRPVAAGSVRIDLVLRVPRGARVAATTWAGAVALENLDGGGEVTTNAGDIAVSNVAGPITTHAGQGQQRFSHVFGALDAEGVRGAMDIDSMRGERLGARLHDGPIDARRVRVGNVRVRTTRGDVSFQGEIVPGGSIEILSYRGNVSVSFARGAAFRLDAFTRRGTIEAPSELAVERAGGRLVGIYDGMGAPAGVTLRSSHGSIRFALVDARF